MDASFLSVQFFTAKIKYLRSQKYDNGVEKNSLPVLPPIIFIALGYNLGGPALVISVLTLVLNLILTGIFVLWVKNLALRSYND